MSKCRSVPVRYPDVLSLRALEASAWCIAKKPNGTGVPPRSVGTTGAGMLEHADLRISTHFAAIAQMGRYQS